MELEVFTFIGLFILSLLVFGEKFNRKELCIMGSILLVILGLLVFVDGITVATGFIRCPPSWRCSKLSCWPI